MRLLATSRQRLGVIDELTWLVPSLSAPGSQETLTVEELEGYESARLFADRASKGHPGFELTPENARAVARICVRLEGIPLAIELAAARVGMLSAGQISERLEHSLNLLTRGEQTADHRHRTLRATLDWGYELLGGPEQALLGMLSVFAGGFTLEAAESVGARGGVEEAEVLELLTTLVEKSLVVAEESWERGARYRLLEPVRQYAGEKLEASGDAEVVRSRHAKFFLALAEEAEQELRGPRQVEWLDRLETEHDNLRASLSWSLGRVLDHGPRIACALSLFWYTRGYLSEGRTYLEAAAGSDTVPATVRAAKRFNSNKFLHASREVSSSVPPSPMVPALLTRMSTRPNSPMVSSTSLSRSAASVKSATPASALAPFAPRSSSSAAACRTSSSLREQIHTWAPSSIKASEMPRPTPLLPPVTRATLPLSASSTVDSFR